MNKEIEEVLNTLDGIASGDWIQMLPKEANLLLSYIEQLEKEYKELKDRNEINIDRNIEAYRIVKQLENNRDKALKKLNASKNHFKTQRENNTITFVIDILKGDSDE